MSWYVWVGIAVVLFFAFLGWAACAIGGRADDRAAAAELARGSQDFDWFHDHSDVRHGGLGR